MPISMKLIKSLSFLLLAMVACAQAVAQAAPPYTAAHLAAAGRVISAMALPERFIIPTRLLLQNSLEKDPENAPLIAATMAPYLQKQYTVNQLKDFFASQFDQATCGQIATFWEGPVGKKLVQTQMQMLHTGEATPLVFTAREKALMKRFDSTSAGKAFLVAMPGIEERFDEYARSTQTKMREHFLLELEKKLRQESAKPAT